jgi:hypothetical protein
MIKACLRMLAAFFKANFRIRASFLLKNYDFSVFGPLVTIKRATASPEQSAFIVR